MERGLAKKRGRRQKLDTFAASLLFEWRRLNLPVANDGMIVSVSGGADSTALLLALNELTTSGRLSLQLLVAHFDHKLRKSSRKDAVSVSRLAAKLGIKAIIGRADVRKLAAESSDNLEQAARRARYSFLERTAIRKKTKYVLVAHTMDDQAETVLLRLLRGSSSEGLSGMEAIRSLTKGSSTSVVRPLLSWARRSDTVGYCRRRNVDFVVDDMNQDENFARVKIRRQLLPLMQSFNNRIVETLFRTATLLREDNTRLAQDAAALLSLATVDLGPNRKSAYPPLNVSVLAGASPAVRRRALRQWLSEGRGDLKRVEHVHLLGVERLLEGLKGGRVAELPDGTTVRRSRGQLELRVKKG